MKLSKRQAEVLEMMDYNDIWDGINGIWLTGFGRVHHKTLESLIRAGLIKIDSEYGYQGAGRFYTRTPAERRAREGKDDQG